MEVLLQRLHARQVTLDRVEHTPERLQVSFCALDVRDAVPNMHLPQHVPAQRTTSLVPFPVARRTCRQSGYSQDHDSMHCY